MIRPSRIPVAATLTALLATPLLGASQPGTAHPAAISTDAGPSRRGPAGPILSRRFAPRLQATMKDGLLLARDRLAHNERCAALFSTLGEPGHVALSVTRYYVASPFQETTTCRHAHAFTGVGARVVRVCRRFESLSADEAAVVILHEALHSAGMPEYPHTSPAMRPWQISELVRLECDL
jgi:hypothetical protein